MKSTQLPSRRLGKELRIDSLECRPAQVEIMEGVKLQGRGKRLLVAWLWSAL